LLITKLRAFIFIALAGFSTALHAQTVRFQTTLGGIDVVLTPAITPLTVANFMNYVNSGEYNNTIFHRSLNAAENSTQAFYLIQGGGYIIKNHLPFQFQPNDPVPSEFKTSNTRGTLAMALFGTDINSGSDQWYFNTIDNSAALDPQTFTVFGNVANDASLAVMDAINGILTFSFDGLTNLPLINYTAGHTVQDANYVYVNSVAPITPTDSAAGVQDAASLLPSTSISPGQILTLYGAQLGPTQVTTLALDSTGTSVATTLQGTQVLFNGVAGPMIFTSTGQIAVVVPYSVANLSTVSVVVSYLGIQASPISFNVVPATPALFTLNQSGKGDAAIVRYVDGSVVNAASPAAPGETLELYGEGYGAVSPGLPDGAVVTGPLSVPAILLIDGQKVPTLYAGGAGGDVNGVLQVNFNVPSLAAGSHQIQIQVGSATSPTGVTLQTK
jgi:uncharacterized protein (TIGR03437 family)